MKTRLLILLSCLLLLSLALFSCGGEADTPPAPGGDAGTASGGDTAPGGNTGGNPEEPKTPRCPRSPA